MEENFQNSIEKSWSFLAFCREKGAPIPKDGVSAKTGEEYHFLVCVDKDGTRTNVNYSRKLGPLTREEIIAQKRELQVVKIKDNKEEGIENLYVLCSQNNADLGEAIDIFSDED